jgi:predicted lipoprotein
MLSNCKLNNPKLALLVALCATSFVGCKDPEPQGDNFDREALLINWADNIIIPSYEGYLSKVEGLQLSIQEFGLETSEENLEILKTALFETYNEWQKVQAFEFGPASNRALLETTNTYPTDTVAIVEAVGSDTWMPGTPATLDNIGLPALDYLVNASELEGFTPQSIEHIERLVDYLHTETHAVIEAWETEYRDEFVSSAGTEMGSSVGEVLNAFNQVYESSVRHQKLGLPSGISTFSQTPLPHLVEAQHAKNWSVELLRTSLESFENIYLGGDGVGLDDYLISLGETEYGAGLDADIKVQIEASHLAIDLLEDPLAEFVVDHQSDAFEIYAELQALVVLWKVDMMSSLGVLITYQDNDGD